MPYSYRMLLADTDIRLIVKTTAQSAKKFWVTIKCLQTPGWTSSRYIVISILSWLNVNVVRMLLSIYKLGRWRTDVLVSAAVWHIEALGFYCIQVSEKHNVSSLRNPKDSYCGEPPFKREVACSRPPAPEIRTLCLESSVTCFTSRLTLLRRSPQEALLWKLIQEAFCRGRRLPRRLSSGGSLRGGSFQEAVLRRLSSARDRLSPFRKA